MKAWQTALNERASKCGLIAFVMNTYVMAVLVIFYLQFSHGLPTVTELPTAISNGTKFTTKKSFGHFVKEFFDFYGKSFEPNSHLISLHVGRWQQKEQKGQKHFTSGQKMYVFSSYLLLINFTKTFVVNCFILFSFLSKGCEKALDSSQ